MKRFVRLCFVFVSAVVSTPGFGEVLKFTWISEGQRIDLPALQVPELRERKLEIRWELDPFTGRLRKWKGIRLVDLIQAAMKDLTVSQKGDVDLLVIKNNEGTRALMPRALVRKYPVLLAVIPPDSSALERGPLHTAVPWTTREKIKTEKLPLETFFVPKVTEVELTNYSSHFGSTFLSERSDPRIMRGEALFYRTCMGCHSLKSWPGVKDVALEFQKKHFDQQAHSKIPGLPMLKIEDLNALDLYLKESKGRKSEFARKLDPM